MKQNCGSRNFSPRLFGHRSTISLTVKVERPIAGDGAVEPRLEERGPLVPEFVSASRVVFAHARHSGEDGLEELEEGEEGLIVARAH